jgi:hypothetical protein
MFWNMPCAQYSYTYISDLKTNITTDVLMPFIWEQEYRPANFEQDIYIARIYAISYVNIFVTASH